MSFSFLKNFLLYLFILFLTTIFVFPAEKDEAKIKPTDNPQVVDLKNELQILKLQKQITTLKQELEDKELLDKKKKLAFEIAFLKSQNEKLKQGVELLEIKKKKLQRDKVEIITNQQYTKTPLDKNKILKISDRRIALNGPIIQNTAKYVSERIHFFNNQNKEYPIFIVIDNCPGGSVFEGYQIIQSMFASKAPIHVIVKGYAASLAAVILTIAQHSYVYPNAWILHHQVRSSFPKTTDVLEFEEEQKRLLKWAERIHGPVAKKLKYKSYKEFYKNMYKNDSNGDWAEFGDNAVALKWADTVILGVVEEGIIDFPSQEDTSHIIKISKELSVDSENNTITLPSPLSFDFYFIYNSDNRYQW